MRRQPDSRAPLRYMIIVSVALRYSIVQDKYVQNCVILCVAMVFCDFPPDLDMLRQIQMQAIDNRRNIHSEPPISCVLPGDPIRNYLRSVRIQYAGINNQKPGHKSEGSAHVYP